MSFTDNFGNPKGLLGRMMLVSMDKEHLPMAQWALERVKIIKGSAEKLPFKDNSIDLITAFETVFFWKKPEKALREIYRSLVKGGCFAVINNYGDPNVDWEKKVPCMTRYTAEQIADMLKTTGFTDITISKKENLFLVIGYKR